MGRARYRATVEYDGTDYYGFQVQADKPTIQGALEQALTDLAAGRSGDRSGTSGDRPGTVVRVVGAGRTDTGVHALGQVIGFLLAWNHTLDDLQRALNARLPEDIVIRDVALAEEGFHPRFSARSRVYRYTVLNQPLRSPLARRFACQVAGPLDVAAMNTAAAALVGWHDFATFGNPSKGENSVRQVMQASWRQAGSTFSFDMEANAYLRRMVRTVVSALLLVGQGRMEAKSMADLLAARERRQAPPPAPACGLCLMQVKY